MKRIFTVLTIVLVMFAVSPVSFAQETAPAENDNLVKAKPADAPAPAATPGDETGEATTQPAEGQPKKPDNKFLFVMIGIMILLFWFMSRGKKKQQQKRQEMLSALSKGDKVTTIGGIVGTIVDVRENEIVLKVNDNNDIRMKFARWAVRGIGEEAKTNDPENEQK